MSKVFLAGLVFVGLWTAGSGWRQNSNPDRPSGPPVAYSRSGGGGGGLAAWPPAHSSAALDRQRHDRWVTQHDGWPHIDAEASSRNTSVLVGKQVILSCVIRDLGNESVSWIRHKDSALLAVNSFLYTTSHRVKVFRDDNSDEWRLSINPVELSDESMYECQVSTTPHTSHFMALDVIEPRTSILGTQELFIEAGSTINLTCLIHTGGQEMSSAHIYWNYNGKIITHNRHRGGTIVIDKRAKDIVTSLIISQADVADSGSYTCDPASSYSQAVIVHVTKGSDAAMRPNAIVRSGAGAVGCRPANTSTHILFFIALPTWLLLAQRQRQLLLTSSTGFC